MDFAFEHAPITLIATQHISSNCNYFDVNFDDSTVFVLSFFLLSDFWNRIFDAHLSC